MVLKTRGLDYDDRVRKECQSLVRCGAVVDLLTLEEDNEARVRTVWNGAIATSLSLTTRRLFPPASGLVFKLVEFNSRAIWLLAQMRGGVLWAHNRETIPLVVAGLVLRRFGRLDRVVWDQHELPRTTVLENPLLRYFWGRLMRACDAVIVANAERRDFLVQKLPAACKTEFVILENRADREFAELPVRDLPQVVSDWARGRPYLLLQGGAHPRRNFMNVVEAVIEGLESDIGIVVVGAHPEALDAKMRERWPDRFDEHVYFTGWIPQMDVPTYIDHAAASVVLYEPWCPNSLYCAPNRLFQAVARGTPVIVGSNPPMVTLVARQGVGVVLDGTGDSPDDIARHVELILAEPGPYRAAARQVLGDMLWERQEAVIVSAWGSPVMCDQPADRIPADESIAG